ncbi:SAM-dependent methyltransferase [Nocardia terpenica]|uniref:S-adenosyl-L-methionine-dependent methyltransferase n=1 Tax=Nocardia terpenica TaxID=455432 RepID=A0A164IYM3_9NOCA|nr:SAM-dependent methyltransferase [Nocardia terpenica]KZM69866.1 SAM-dependent methyltransferase [Nocardia terpenica]NQE91229.1 SAM-dependent methyltransferase [Nocardia terpenica]
MRTERDTWDIISSVGATALGAAAARAMETSRPDALVRDDYAALFVAASGHEGMGRLLKDPGSSDEWFLSSGIMGLRTKFCDDHFLAAAEAGMRQAVILAAGLDVRAYRLAWPAGTVVFGLDQPKVLEFKRQVLDDNNAEPAADRRAIAMDLRDDWPAALLNAGFDPSVPTSWTAEGLLPYLPGAAQNVLFERIERLSAPGSRVALDALSGQDLEKLTKFTDEHVRNSPVAEIGLSDLFYTDERADPEDWFGTRGWTATPVSVLALAQRYGRELPPLPEPFGDLFLSSPFVEIVKPLTTPAP